MRLAIFSDLHLEFYKDHLSILRRLAPPKVNADVFVNAGDTHAHSIARSGVEKFFDGEKYFSIKGNHDYYGNEFPDVGDDLFSAEFDGVKFAGATLWTGFTPDKWYDYRYGMSCSSAISGNTYEQHQKKYVEDKHFLLGSGADVIVSHTTPSPESCAKKWEGHFLNPFFHNDLRNEILSMKNPPKLWVHGHVHNKCHYRIGSTLVVCNPLGYPNEVFNSVHKYDPMIVEINDKRAEVVNA